MEILKNTIKFLYLKKKFYVIGELIKKVKYFKGIEIL